MDEEQWPSPAQPSKPVPGAFGPVDEPLEFAARPANDIEIDPFESGTQLRPIEGAVIADPPADDGVVHLCEVLQGFVAAVMKPPAPDFPTDALQCLRTGCRQETMGRLPLPHRFARPELNCGLRDSWSPIGNRHKLFRWLATPQARAALLTFRIHHRPG